MSLFVSFWRAVFLIFMIYKLLTKLKFLFTLETLDICFKVFQLGGGRNHLLTKKLLLFTNYITVVMLVAVAGIIGYPFFGDCLRRITIKTLGE